MYRRPPQINVGMTPDALEALTRVKTLLAISGCQGTTAEAVRYALQQTAARMAADIGDKGVRARG